MSLAKYENKRDFTKTAEPKAGKSPLKTKLLFVVQQHAASRLHYDFRLEMEGVLKSWAVPKGPSTDPAVKRLAMMVEDHPYDYLKFEGVIPAGEYGGGTVIVWDQGHYEPIEPIKGKQAREEHLLEQLKTGSVKIILHGKKLKGEFALVKTKGMGDNAWLLIKHKDQFAAAADIIKKNKSVVSGKTLAGVKRAGTKVWNDGKEQAVAKQSAVAEQAPPRKKAPAKKSQAAAKKAAPQKKMTPAKKPVGRGTKTTPRKKPATKK